MTAKKSNRRSERALAFQVLYALEFVNPNSKKDVEEAFCNVPRPDDEKAKPEGFAYSLVQGVCKYSSQIDEIIAKYTTNWRIERLGKVEITILRIAVYEMQYCEDIPCKVSINESLELSKQFADAKSLAFVNGVLDAINKDLIEKNTNQVNKGE